MNQKPRDKFVYSWNWDYEQHRNLFSGMGRKREAGLDQDMVFAYVKIKIDWYVQLMHTNKQRANSGGWREAH